ncbi:hypothetical protein DSAG12_02169 [Promethearchaeum syntrophicum]|uniref:Uncharacterized protein n=1 Tax=Promethearchaeum syntrophicum TaxID=2594042 RepID=A0A5B9DAS5_9ARCH|nr:hypothetical protein [Candidatus Prometheoarchaeum syntrophicum]
MSSTNLPLVWYLGVIVNGFLGTIAFIFAIKSVYRGKEKIKSEKRNPWHISLIFSQICFGLYTFSILLTYLILNINQRNMGNDEIPITHGHWIFFAGFLIFYLVSVILQLGYFKTKMKWIFILFIIFYIVTTIPMYNFIVFWKGGYVTIHQIDEFWGRVNIFSNISLYALVFVLSFIKFNQSHEYIYEKKDNHELSLIKDNLVKSDNFRFSYYAFWNMIISGIFLLGSLLPTAEMGGVINPVNLKVVGMVIFTAVLTSQMILQKEPINPKYVSLICIIEKTKYNEFEHFQNKTLNKIIFSVSLFVILKMIISIEQDYVHYYPDSQAGVDAGVYFYFFTKVAVQWFGHLYGLIIPAIIFIIIGIIGLLYQKKKSFGIVYFLIIMGAQVLLSLLLKTISLPYSNPVHFHFLNSIAFYLPPILGVGILFWIRQKINIKIDVNYFTEIFRGKKIIKTPLSPFLICLSTFIATVTTDFFYPITSTGKILIGGDGIVDGIVVFPILGSLICYILTLFLGLLFPSWSN